MLQRLESPSRTTSGYLLRPCHRPGNDPQALSYVPAEGYNTSFVDTTHTIPYGYMRRGQTREHGDYGYRSQPKRYIHYKSNMSRIGNISYCSDAQYDFRTEAVGYISLASHRHSETIDRIGILFPPSLLMPRSLSFSSYGFRGFTLPN